MRLLRYATVFSLVAIPAQAGPAILPLVGASAAFMASTAGAIVSAAITMAVSVGISMVAQALFKRSAPAATGPAPNNRLDTRQSIRQPIAPHQVIYGEARVSGVYADMWVRNGNQTLYFPLILAGHECAEVGQLYFNDQASSRDVYGNIVSGAYAGNAVVSIALGSDDQAVNGLLQIEAPERWTSEHRLRGLTYVACQLFWDNTTGTGNPGSGTFQVSHLGAKLWQTGIPNITAYVKGKKVYDPRTGLTAWSNNWALCVADYLCDPLYGLGVDYDTGIDEEALIAAANASDEDVSLAGGGTEKRYTIDGAFKCDGSPDEILGLLLAAGHGKAIYDGERWAIQAGVYQTPAITLTDDDMRGGSTLQTLTSARDSFNAVKGTAPIGTLMQPADFPAVISDTFRAADGGIEKFKDIELPFTRSAARCQRIAKIDLLKARQEIVETFKGKLSCWRVKAGDTILRTSTRYGWTSKPFEVASVKFAIDEDADGNPVLGVDLVLLETAPEVYDWSTSEESDVDPAPNSELPDVFDVLPPTNLLVEEEIYSTRDGAGVKAKATVTWSASPDAFVVDYRVEVRPSGASAWLPRAVVIGTRHDVEDIVPGLWEFRVAARNTIGSLSPWLVVPKTITGLLAPPSAPNGLTLQAAGGLAVLSWQQTSDLDVRIGGHIVFKHAASGTNWAEAVSIGEALPGGVTTAVLPLRSGTYLAKFRDSSGVYSATAASIAADQVSLLDLATLQTVTESPAFAGSRSGAYVDGGALALDSSGDFDDVTTVDDLPSWDFSGGVRTSGSYAFFTVVDLGAVKSVRLTPSIAAQVFDVFDSFDAREGDVDSWLSWDNVISGDEADAVLMVRRTADDPAGTPSWGPWVRLDAGEFSGRGFQFRLDLVSRNPNFNIRITGLSVAVEERV